MKIKNGFTFIEILIVVSIIGILASIGMVSYASASKKSRDGKRKADMEQVRAALEMYRVDNDGYPVSGSVVPGESLEDYLDSVPHDPRCPDGSCVPGFDDYSYSSCASAPCYDYEFCADKLEITEEPYCVSNP